MSTVAVLGEPVRIRGFALAGALALEAETPAEVREQWARIPADVAVVVLTPAAASALAVPGPLTAGPMTVVMPA